MADFDGADFDGLDFDVDSNIGSGGPGSFYWGPYFPDAGGGVYWFPHFPEGGIDTSLVDPVGPGAAATFALDLEAGATFTLIWSTEIFKAYDGREERRSKVTLPKRKIAGTAFLQAGATRSVRAKLMRYASIGAPFLVGLPFDEMTIVEDSPTTVLSVGDTSLIDWGVIGQRAVLFNTDEDGKPTFVDVAVQDVGANTITIDAAYPDLALAGARLVPTVAVYLDPQQSISRYTSDEGIESWSITATAILFGYEQDESNARAALSESTGVLHGATLGTVVSGTAGNGYTLQMISDGDPIAGSTLEHVSGNSYRYHFVPASSPVLGAIKTTISQMVSVLASTFVLLGVYDASDVLDTDDELSVVLAGGAGKLWGSMGNGASLTMFQSKPVWDRGITVDGSSADSLQSLTTIIDLGGKLANIGQANASDWGRAILARDDLGAPFQWVKLFLFTVRGRALSWWLPTDSKDLIPVAGSSSGVTLVIEGPSSESGDFFGWYPTLRSLIRIIQDDGTITYAKIVTATDNLDNTITLVCHDDADTLITLSSSEITMISWLELCRFEKDEFQFSISGSTFTLPTQARVVQR